MPNWKIKSNWKTIEFAILWSIFVVTTLIQYRRIFTNAYTPRGDGVRIFPYAEFTEHAAALYPLWNPWKLGGTPILATPERYNWVSWIIDTTSDWANLQLNLLILLVMLLVISTAALIGRTLGISKQGTIFTLIVLSGSYYFQDIVPAGRINSMMIQLCTLGAILFYFRWLLNRRFLNFSVAAILTGCALTTNGHYCLIFLYPALLAGGVVLNLKTQTAAPAIYKSMFQIVALSVIGVMALSIFFYSQVLYLLAAHLDFPTRNFLGAKVSIPSTLPNLFLPFYYSIGKIPHGNIYPYISIAGLPLLLIYILNRKQIVKTPEVFTISLLWMSLSLFVCLSSIPGLYTLIENLQFVPILKNIRHNFGILFTITVAGSILVGAAYDQLSLHTRKPLWHGVLPLASVAILFLLAGFLQLIQTERFKRGSKFDFEKIIEFAGNNISNVYLYAILILLVIVPYTLLSRNRLKIYLFFLVMIPPLAIDFDLGGKKSFNKPVSDEIVEILSGDSNYFRYWNVGSGNQDMIGMPRVRSLTGYSKYFSPQHRLAMSTLLGVEIIALRPKWAKVNWTPNPNMKILQRLNIKYLRIKNTRITIPEGSDWSPDLGENWTRVFKNKSYSLWKNEDWESQLYLTGQYELHSSPEQAITALAKLPLDDNRVGLEANPGFEPNDYFSRNVEFTLYSENKLMLEFESAQKALLYLPEYWDAGWKASINGEEVKLLRADGVFRAIPVPAGKSKVLVYFSPDYLPVVTFISLSTILVLLVLSILDARARRFHPELLIESQR